jgi:DNA-binding NarL/FixJ family response regulator
MLPASASPETRVLVIDDHELFRMGVCHLIDATPGLTVSGQAGDARSAFVLLDTTLADVVLMDLSLPGMDGVAATREVHRRRPEARVVLLSGFTHAQAILDGFAAGARGYVAKREPPAILIEAVRAVLRGHRYVSPSLAPMVEGAVGTDPLSPLSAREREVFDLAVRGLRNREIARELCISIKTVGSHRMRINEKLGCSSPGDLVRFAASNGILSSVMPATVRAAEGE